jgi:hypothetical protein
LVESSFWTLSLPPSINEKSLEVDASVLPCDIKSSLGISINQSLEPSFEPSFGSGNDSDFVIVYGRSVDFTSELLRPRVEGFSEGFPDNNCDLISSSCSRMTLLSSKSSRELSEISASSSFLSLRLSAYGCF